MIPTFQLGQFGRSGQQATPVITDPNFSSVGLLLHFNGSDGATTTTDSSASGHTLTANGNVQLDTAQAKWGASSSLFDGTGDYWTIPHHADFSIEDGAFTVEGWLRRAASGVAHNILNKRPAVGTSGWGWRINADNTMTFFYTGGAVVTSTGTVASGSWVHVAATRTGGTFRLFIAGTHDGTNSSVSNGSLNSEQLKIGVDNDLLNGFDGHIDDLRITKGVCRYTASFTPPTAAFPDA